MASATGQDGITIMLSPATMARGNLLLLGVSTTSLDTVTPFSTGTDATLGTNDDLYKGLSINQVVIHDDDGIATNMNSGSLVIGNGTTADSTVVFAKGDNPIVIDLDMVGDTSATAGNQSMLNVKISTPTLGIKVGAMYVSNSNANAAGIDKDGAVLAGAEGDGTSQDGGTPIKISNAMEIVLGATSINIQLGSEAQTIYGGAEVGAVGAVLNPSAMILVDATIQGGLTINNSSLIDAGGLITGGSISMKSLSIKDAGGANLNALVGVNVEDNLLQTNAAYAGAGATEGGLIVTLGGLGGKGVDGLYGPRTAGAFNPAGTNDDTGVDISINNTVLGSATAQDLGDVQILGLQLGGTSLIIRGH
ncbi:MAG: hypothetical protein I8H92_10615 [Moraxellaceae bacterium]|nr:hypothetical protein [Moraxellaceae bacterium]